MFKVVAAILYCIYCMTAVNVYAGYDEDVAAINKGMPKQVKLFNKRQIECNHWAGEEPYDKARGLEIAAAAKRLRCDTLEKDEKNLRKKYKSRANIINSINKAKEFF